MAAAAASNVKYVGFGAVWLGCPQHFVDFIVDFGIIKRQLVVNLAVKLVIDSVALVCLKWLGLCCEALDLDVGAV